MDVNRGQFNVFMQFAILRPLAKVGQWRSGFFWGVETEHRHCLAKAVLAGELDLELDLVQLDFVAYHDAHLGLVHHDKVTTLSL